MSLEVLDPGLLLTVQDLGRQGHEHLGVPRAGAADTRSLAAANRLVGNEPGAAALEATLLGPRLRALADVEIAIAGADFEPVRLTGNRPVDGSRAIRLAADEELGFLEAGDPDRGCRAYIAIAGGIDVPVVLGSRSTSLAGAFGGFDGRPLRAGDVLRTLPPRPVGTDEPRPGQVDRSAAGWTSEPIRILPGPAADDPDGGSERWATLLDTTWTVGLDSDRRGLRLEPPVDARPGLGAVPADQPSHGVVVGAIQLSPAGHPLVLMPDGGVTGGYPVIAIVVSADLPLLGQLTPGAAIHFASARVRLDE